MSVASIGLRKEPTGCAIGFHADVIATAKRDLKAGEMLDGGGRLHSLRQAVPGREIDRPRQPAAGPGAQRETA